MKIRFFVILILSFHVAALAMQLPDISNLNVPNCAPNANLDYDLNSEPDTVVSEGDRAADIADLDEAIELFEANPHFLN